MRKMEECTACKFFNECRFSHLRNGVDHCNFFIRVVADPQTFDYEQKLRDLLAIIHKDGGHYTEQHGIKKSFDDAKNEYYRLRVIEQTTDKRVDLKEDKPCPKCKHAKGSTGMELQWVCEHCGYREAEK